MFCILFNYSIISQNIPMSITSTKDPHLTPVHEWDVVDVCCLCHAALAQDSPEPSDVYLNRILNIMFSYLTKENRIEIENYLAEKKYLPAVKIELAK